MSAPRWVRWVLIRVAPPFSWLERKLAVRMLVKYPGLTFLGGVSIAFAVFPLPDGQRIVDIRLWDASSGRIERRALFDASAWREQLRTIEDVTVYRTRERNLITADGLGEPVQVAEMGAAFRFSDLQEGARTVVVDQASSTAFSAAAGTPRSATAQTRTTGIRRRSPAPGWRSWASSRALRIQPAEALRVDG